VHPSAEDYRIIAGIHNQAAIRIRSLRVFHGGGWNWLPVRSVSAGAQPSPPAPTGTQPFTIDPPSNSNGVVLNVADFGAVADGASPPSAGLDRNLEAFKAAVAKAREAKAAKLFVPKGVYRFTSGATIEIKDLSDFIFDGGGSTFLFHQIHGGSGGMYIGTCSRCIFSNFNLDWDWNIDPLASIGKITAVAPDRSYFEMRFETTAPLDPKRWVTMNALDEKLRAPGIGGEWGGFTPKRIGSLDPQTVRVWPSWPIGVKAVQLYLLRHYTYEKHGVVMGHNTHLSLQDVSIFSFPGIGFIVGGDQHHFECVRCRVTFPENQRRPITTTADGFHVAQSQGFIRLQDCDFGYMGDDGVNIHDNYHAGVRRVDDYTLVAERIVPWKYPYAPGDPVEIRNADYLHRQGHESDQQLQDQRSGAGVRPEAAEPPSLGRDAFQSPLRFAQLYHPQLLLPRKPRARHPGPGRRRPDRGKPLLPQPVLGAAPGSGLVRRLRRTQRDRAQQRVRFGESGGGQRRIDRICERRSGRGQPHSCLGWKAFFWRTIRSSRCPDPRSMRPRSRT
jgi:hypothetical protein